MPRLPKLIGPHAHAKPACAVMLMLLALSSTGCATRLVPPSECPVNPTAPALTESLPSETYSISAQRDMEAWRKRLGDTPATSKR